MAKLDKFYILKDFEKVKQFNVIIQPALRPHIKQSSIVSPSYPLITDFIIFPHTLQSKHFIAHFRGHWREYLKLIFHCEQLNGERKSAHRYKKGHWYGVLPPSVTMCVGSCTGMCVWVCVWENLLALSHAASSTHTFTE